MINAEKNITHLTIEDTNHLYTTIVKITEEGQTILEMLENLICREFNIANGDMKSELRHMPVPRARGAFVRILRSKFDFPLKLIGLYLGGRDHSTILMAEQRTKAFYIKSDKYRLQYNRVEKAFANFLSENGFASKG